MSELLSTPRDQGSALPSNFYLNNILNPTYRPRKFNNKGAALTLIWNFSALFLFIFFIVSNDVKMFDHRFQIALALTALAYPIAGWLADVYIGRYRVLKFSMIIMWSGGILYVTSVILSVTFNGRFDEFMVISVAIGLLGLSAYQANAIQFGLDQLIDASSSDISSYISWYAWTFFLAYVIVDFSQGCTCLRYTPISSLLAPVFLTVCVCSDFLFNDWLIKEPVTFNPLKLIFSVLRFAARNKYPRQRSAFTYWDDKPYKRIDLAKDKFGGPYTTEQVEDVKTFFRISIIVIIGSLFVGLVFVVNTTVGKKMIPHYQDPYVYGNCSLNFSTYLQDCFEKVVVKATGHLTMLVLIPVFEFILYPLLWKCPIKIGIMRKFILGIFLQLIYILSLLTLEIVGHYVTSRDPNSASQNVSCMLANTQENTLILHYKWTAVPKIFNGISTYCLLTSTVEFVCAQSPYSMKGLMGGILYCVSGLAVLLSLGMKTLFQKLFEKKLSSILYSCGVWYFSSVALLSGIWIVVACVVSKWYTKRRRDENVRNEHMFATD